MSRTRNKTKPGIIYRIRCIPTKKVYVGLTTNNSPARYIQSHFKTALTSKKKKLFYDAIRKHGQNAFECTIMCECQNGIDLSYAERAFIAYYGGPYGNTYNMTEGGDGIGSFKHSDETRAKQRTSKLGSLNPMYGRPGTRRGISGQLHPSYGIPRSEEIKKKIRDAQIGPLSHSYGKPSPMLGKRLSKEARVKLSVATTELNLIGERNPMYGRSFYDVWVEKYGNEEANRRFEKWKHKQRNRNVTRETRIKLSMTFKGKKKRPTSEEHRHNLSKAHAGKPWSEKRRSMHEAKKLLASQSS